MSEETTESRAVRRKIALWLVAAVVLGIVVGYLGGSPDGSLWRTVGGALTWGFVLTCLKLLMPALRLTAIVIAVHFVAAIAAYNVIPWVP